MLTLILFCNGIVEPDWLAKPERPNRRLHQRVKTTISLFLALHDAHSRLTTRKRVIFPWNSRFRLNFSDFQAKNSSHGGNYSPYSTGELSGENEHILLTKRYSFTTKPTVNTTIKYIYARIGYANGKIGSNRGAARLSSSTTIRQMPLNPLNSGENYPLSNPLSNIWCEWLRINLNVRHVWTHELHIKSNETQSRWLWKNHKSIANPFMSFFNKCNSAWQTVDRCGILDKMQIQHAKIDHQNNTP